MTNVGYYYYYNYVMSGVTIVTIVKICTALSVWKLEEKSATEQLVSPEPDLFIKPILPDRDEFLVLACDGIWDVMTNQEMCDFVSSRMKITEDLEDVANQVIDTCLYKASCGTPLCEMS